LHQSLRDTPSHFTPSPLRSCMAASPRFLLDTAHAIEANRSIAPRRHLASSSIPLYFDRLLLLLAQRLLLALHAPHGKVTAFEIDRLKTPAHPIAQRVVGSDPIRAFVDVLVRFFRNARGSNAATPCGLQVPLTGSRSERRCTTCGGRPNRAASTAASWVCELDAGERGAVHCPHGKMAQGHAFLAANGRCGRSWLTALITTVGE
jgi:hypothetical protein